MFPKKPAAPGAHRNNALAVSLAVLLSSCAAPAPQEPIAHAVAAATPTAEGPVRWFASGWWLPGAAGFAPSVQITQTDGMLVLTDRSVLWRRWDETRRDWRTWRQIALADIRSIALAQGGTQRLIVIQRTDSGYDSFGLTSGSEPVPDAKKTAQGYRALAALLALPAGAAPACHPEARHTGIPPAS